MEGPSIITAAVRVPTARFPKEPSPLPRVLQGWLAPKVDYKRASGTRVEALRPGLALKHRTEVVVVVETCGKGSLLHGPVTLSGCATHRARTISSGLAVGTRTTPAATPANATPPLAPTILVASGARISNARVTEIATTLAPTTRGAGTHACHARA